MIHGDVIRDDGLTQLQRADSAAVITLIDVARRNAFSLEMSRSLAAGVREATADDAIRAVVVTARPPVFCAGGSLDDLLSPRAALTEVYEGFDALRNAAVPTIAAVAGPVIGAGVNIPLACDLVIVGESARFDPRFLDLGIHPGGGHLWQLDRTVGRQAAAALVIFGEVWSGAEAAARGLAYRCVPDDELLPTALRLAARVADRPRELTERTKRTLALSAQLPTVEDAIQVELSAQEWSMQTPEFAARVAAARERIAVGRQARATRPS